jgi:SNF2 family DNA or RNA helicase
MILQHEQTVQIDVIPPGSRFKKKMIITKRGDRLWLKFPYDARLLQEIKTSFSGTKWHGYEERPIKQWSVKDCYHNWWQLEYLQGKNPYAPYIVQTSTEFEFGRPLYFHQKEMTYHLLLKHYCLISGEMGTGKTLAVIEALERSGASRVLYVAPKSAIAAVQLEFMKWNALIWPQFVTYNALKGIVENWKSGQSVYEVIVYDECHKLKTPTSQRSEAAMYLADCVRREHGDNGYVWLMSGSPAPKSPLDWYNQCETACPGYLKEGSIHKFKERLGIVANAENQVTGGVYQQLVTWRDNESKCDTCGCTQDDPKHDVINSLDNSYHVFKPCTNEVALLYKRMNGLVIVRLKKDCLDLPEKQYQTIVCKPTAEILRAASMIAQTSTSTISAMTLLRELSDGFQYKETLVGKEPCTLCHGSKLYKTWVYTGNEEEPSQPTNYENDPDWEFRDTPCPRCGATGEIDKVERTTVFVPCPKEDALRDLVDQHDEVGRIVTYAGFTGSVDRCVDIIKSIQGWEYIRVDGRGWSSSIGGNPTGLLRAFQDYKEQFPRIAFIGQPGAAGTGLTLTASPSIVYYSNDFNGESRIQSEDRIHRPGMDLNRGATIYDLVHLPTDQYIIDILKKKRELQSISLGELKEALLSQ